MGKRGFLFLLLSLLVVTDAEARTTKQSGLTCGNARLIIECSVIDSTTPNFQVGDKVGLCQADDEFGISIASEAGTDLFPATMSPAPNDVAFQFKAVVGKQYVELSIAKDQRSSMPSVIVVHNPNGSSDWGLMAGLTCQSATGSRRR